MIVPGLLLGVALAELPPPDYRAALSSSAADEVARLAREAGMDAARAFARRWASHVAPDANVAYELGLAWRIAGDEREALAAFDEALKLDPTLVAARYDRGEVYLNRGELAEAQADFLEVVRLQPEAWPGHFRLADLAGRQGDAAAFEAHLLAALRFGWSARTVVGDPRWRGWLDDPKLGPVLARLITVYQDERVLQEIRASP